VGVLARLDAVISLSIEREFFEVPIYRCSPGQHRIETDREKARYLAPIEHEKESNPENYAFAERRFDKHTRYAWDFNEIVGYLRLYPLGTQIRGELWLMDAIRIRRGTKKKIRWVGKAFELGCKQAESNSDIAMRVLGRVKAMEGEAPCKGRYIDTRSLRNAAFVINWRALVGFSVQ
jgi:hypothetical protein